MRVLTKKNILIAATYSAVMVLGMVLGPKFARENENSKNGTFLPFGFNARNDKVNRVLELINQKYVDPVKLDTVNDRAIEEILSHLDPHSTYLPPVEAQLLYEDLEGNFNGIGIEYYLLNDTLLVTSVSPGGPAFKAGLLTGDRILNINRKNITGKNITAKKVVESIRGKKGTSVNLLVKRSGANKLKNISIVRDRITISSVDASYLLTSQTGYVKISRFGAKTNEDFVAALSTLQKAGAKNLVLDMRENGGGYLNSATALADQFLPDKKLIVYTEGAHEPRTNYYATAEGKFEQGKLVVLIDENTASASEIVAGAVQDLDRGTIIGRRSFGKGLVQEQFDFGDGSALNLTIARYYTPSGRSIQKPYDKGIEAYYSEVRERYHEGKASSAEENNPETTPAVKQKTYISQSGKLLYGGGGITPDIYIPVDTTGYNDFYSAVYAGGILNDFAFNYLLKEQIPSSISEFIEKFTVTDEQYQRFLELVKSKNITYNNLQAEVSGNEIRRDLKSLLARYHFGQEGYYKVLNANDRAITRSMEVLK